MALQNAPSRWRDSSKIRQAQDSLPDLAAFKGALSSRRECTLAPRVDALKVCQHCSCTCSSSVTCFADALRQVCRRLDSIDCKLQSHVACNSSTDTEAAVTGWPHHVGEEAEGVVAVEQLTTDPDQTFSASLEADLALGLPSRDSLTKAGERHSKRSRVLQDIVDDAELRPSLRFKIRQVVRHPMFDIGIFIIILANSVLIGVDAEGAAVNPQHDHETFELIAFAFSCVFIFELVIMFVAEGMRGYFRDMDGWRLFDLIIVLESMGSVVLFFGSRNAATSHVLNLRILRSLKVMKLLRVLRVGRIFQFAVALRELVSGIISTLRLLGWATVLLALVVYIFAAFFTSLLDLRDAKPATDLKPFFGSIGESSMTLFQTMFGGFSWREVALPLRRAGAIYEVAFLMFVIITILTVLNVVTGVFAAVAITNAENDPELIAMNIDANNLRLNVLSERLFALIDLDGSGKVTMPELEEASHKKEFQALLKAMNIDAHDFLLLFTVLDSDGDGLLEMNELCRGLHDLSGTGIGLELARVQLAQQKLLQHVKQVHSHQARHFEWQKKVDINPAVPGIVHDARLRSTL